jgi:hypothetical protein
VDGVNNHCRNYLRDVTISTGEFGFQQFLSPCYSACSLLSAYIAIEIVPSSRVHKNFAAWWRCLAVAHGRSAMRALRAKQE